MAYASHIINHSKKVHHLLSLSLPLNFPFVCMYTLFYLIMIVYEGDFQFSFFFFFLLNFDLSLLVSNPKTNSFSG
jgi:hypothetical protein